MKKHWPLILAALVLFAYHYQHAMTILFLPKGTIIFNDFSILTYTCNAARNFFAESGTFWGYDPNFMAGYPLTFIWNSNVALQVLAVALKHVEVEVVIRSFTFMSLMLFPVFFYWTMRNFLFNSWESLAGTILGTIYFRMSIPDMFHLTGMVTAGMITYLGIFLISLIFRWCKSPGVMSAALLFIFSALSLLVHKTVIVIVFFPAALLLILYFKRMGFLKSAVLFVAAATAIAANWFWISPMLKFMKFKTFLWDAPFWVNRDPLLPFKDYFSLGGKVITVDYGRFGIAHTAILWLLLIAGAAGLAAWRKNRDERFLPISLTVCFLFVFSYYGGFIPRLAELNPVRYLPVMNLLLVLPASAALISLYRGRGAGTAVKILFLAIAFGATLITFYHLERFNPLLRLHRGAPETRDVDALISKLRSLPLGGRVMLEDSGVMDTESKGQVYAFSQLPAQFPQLTGKQFIGGPYPYVFLTFNKVSFHDGIFLGEKIDDIPIETMEKRLDLYDIKWISCWSARSKFYFDSYPARFKPVWSGGIFRIYEAPRAPNPFIAGKGVVKSTYNRIELSDLQPERGEVIIKYHWIDTLRATPRRRIERYPVQGDPAGFIRIMNPPRTMVIRNP